MGSILLPLRMVQKNIPCVEERDLRVINLVCPARAAQSDTIKRKLWIAK